MDPYTGQPWQYPVDSYHTTGNGSRAPLPTSTAQTAVPVGMQFQDPVGGQAYMVQPYAGDDTDLFEFGMLGVFGYDDPMPQVQYATPQVIQPAPAPAPVPVPVPASVPVPPADPCADDMKSVVYNAFAEALAATQQEHLPPLEQLARLEDFRKTCGHLINQSWHSMRVDLARDIANAALPFYRKLAPKVATQAQTRVMSFFSGFESWGLKTLNELLARMPLLGHVVQFSVVPPDGNGTVHAPMLPILRSPQAQAGQTPQQFQPPAPPPLSVPAMPSAIGTAPGTMQGGSVPFATANVLLAPSFAPARPPSRDRPSYRDDTKVQVWEAYSRLLEVLAQSGTSPAMRLEALMGFRDISRQLINKAWAGLRLDIASELISLAVSAYDYAARELQPKSVCPLPEFFDGFVPSGLAVMNEALAATACGKGGLQGKLVLARVMPVVQQAPQTGDNTVSTNPHLARQGRRS